MPGRSRVKIAEEVRLRLSPSATAELAGLALHAQADAGLDSADFLIVAMPPGTALEAAAIVEAACDRVATAAARRPAPA